MSVVTNILLHLSVDEEDKRIEQVNSFFFVEGQPVHPPLVSVDDPCLPRCWYGGTKMLEASIYIGAFNHLNFQGFVEHLQAISWKEDEVIQLFVQEEEDIQFRLINISLYK